MATLELYGSSRLPAHAGVAGVAGVDAAQTFRNTTWRPIAERAPACAPRRHRPTVPVLVEDGKIVQIGWQGRGCVLGPD